MLLAGLGAQLTKIEEPAAGDISRRCGPFPKDNPHTDKSGLFHYLNRNKHGITLDVRNATGREILLELIKDADVLVEDMLPMVAQNLKLDYRYLQEVNPGLIVVSITPFGQTGPYKDYKAYAINASALGGMSTIVGMPQREPLTPPFALDAKMKKDSTLISPRPNHGQFSIPATSYRPSFTAEGNEPGPDIAPMLPIPTRCCPARTDTSP
jgi:crotonobetainyl-CoA:carnitine CoA-transferase CaiB-like acyl-CoA transferase